MIRKHKFKYSILTAVGGLSLLGGVVGAGAVGANLLTNAAFDQGATGWTVAPSTPWVVAAGNLDGNLVVSNNAPWDLKTVGMVGQCVPVEPGTEYRLSAQSYLPAGQEREGGGQAMIVFYGGVECGGGQLTAWETGTAAWEDNWSNLMLERIAPPGAKSAWAALSATKNKPWAGDDWEAPLTVYFDDAFFGEAGVSPAEDHRGEDGEPVALEEPENPEPPDEPQVEGERPEDEPTGEGEPTLEGDPDAGPPDEPQVEDEPGDEPQDEPGDEPQGESGDEPQGEPGDEPQDGPGDETQDEPTGDQPQELDEPGDDDVKSPKAPDTGTGFATDQPDTMLAAGAIGVMMAAAVGGAMLVPARRKR